jgi:hypothetical protein
MDVQDVIYKTKAIRVLAFIVIYYLVSPNVKQNFCVIAGVVNLGVLNIASKDSVLTVYLELAI